METRLSLIFKISTPQYATGSPLLLNACALYFDNVDKSFIAQIKWQNIGKKILRAVMVELVCFDAFNHEVEKHSYQYDHLEAGSRAFFGDREAIVLESERINRYQVYVKAISYADGTIEEFAKPKAYTLLPETRPQELQGELLEQYKRDLCQQGIETTIKYQFQHSSGLWQCVCGSWQGEDSACPICSCTFSMLMAATDVSVLKQHLNEYKARIAQQEEENKALAYDAALDLLARANEADDIHKEEQYRMSAHHFDDLGDYRDAAQLAKDCLLQAEAIRKNKIYHEAIAVAEHKTAISQKRAVDLFQSIPGWQDADARAEHCRISAKRLECKERIAAEKEAKKRKRIKIISVVAVFSMIALVILTTKVIIPTSKYNRAVSLMRDAKYSEAIAAFEALDGYRDSASQIDNCRIAILDIKYESAKMLIDEGKYTEAIAAFEALDGYRDSAAKIPETYYLQGEALLAAGDYAGAVIAFQNVGSYSDAQTRILECYYARAEALLAAKYYGSASTAFKMADNYSDAETRILEPFYVQGEDLLAQGKEDEAIAVFKNIIGYSNATERYQMIYYAQAERLLAAKDYAGASEKFALAGDYSDAASRVLEPYYVQAEDLLASKDYDGASAAFIKAGNYSDAASRILEPYYAQAEDLLASKDYDGASAAFKKAGDYSNAKARILEPYYVQGEALLAQGKEDEAIAVFKKVDGYSNATERYQMIYYAQAERLLAAKDYAGASEKFALAGDYSDAASRVLEPYYAQAEDLLASKDYDGASAAFKKAGDYSNAASRILEPYYVQGKNLLSQSKEEEAIAAFKKANNYSDAKKQYQKIYYTQAERLLAAKKYDGAMVAFANAGNYSNATDMITETNYQKALSLLDAGDYNGAYAIFITLRTYKDVDNLLATDKNLKKVAAVAALEVTITAGKYVTFGRYPQAKAGHDDTPIEWLVLNREGNKALLISRYALDCQPYHTSETTITWEKCSLRKWLNGTFINRAFSTLEQSAILTTTVTADKSPSWRTNPGNATKDKVFLLSIVEMEKYFKNGASRKCLSTAYAIKQGALYPLDCHWWLRSPGHKGTYAAYASGTVNIPCSGVRNDGYAVRPALWVKLDSEIFLSDPSILTPTPANSTVNSAKVESCAHYETLRQGSVGDDVIKMKMRLQELGYFNVTATLSNQYNRATAVRVQLFQKANGLNQTGIADSATLALLYSDEAKQNPYDQ